jgi:membrane-bound metal-dependent hydrolase YbcI (DUF457 family)
MIAGHFGFAAAVKAKARATPLWALMLGSQWLDVVFVPLLAAKVEWLEPTAGSKPGDYGAVIIHADYTHSLIGALLLSALFGVLFWRRYGSGPAVVLGLTSLSHWFLDLLFHRADMPIVPGGAGNLPRLGFALWTYPSVAAAIELLLVVVGSATYWRAAAQVAGSDSAAQRRATVCGISIFAAGILTLALNLLGM